MCFSAKFRILLGYRMLHTFICFGLRATHNLDITTGAGCRFHISMGTALVCCSDLLPSPSEHILAVVPFYPSGVSSAIALDGAASHTATGVSDCLTNGFVWIYPIGRRLSRAFHVVTYAYPPKRGFLVFKYVVDRASGFALPSLPVAPVLIKP